MAFDNSTTQTLRTVLDALEVNRSLTDTKRRDLISATNRVASLLHKPPQDIPANAPDLRRMLASVHPVQVGIAPKTWANIKSNLARALRVTRSLPRGIPKTERSAKWLEFLSNADAKHQIHVLSRLVGFCCHRSLEPEHVSDAVIQELQRYLNAHILSKEPSVLCKDMAQTWNAIITRNDLPLQKLTYQKGGTHKCIPLSAYPESLLADFAAYQDRVSHADIFDEDAPTRPQAPISLRNNKARLRQYLDALVQAGEDPRGLIDLRTAITPERMKRAFIAYMERRDLKNPPASLNNIAMLLLAIARHHLKLPQNQIDAIANIRKHTATEPRGMSPKNKLRLTQFDDWRNVARLVSLPDQLMERAKAGEANRLAGLDAMYATAIMILLACPMRIKNLASLDLDQHLISQAHGTHTIYSIRIEGSEVKNGEDIEVQLSARNSRLLHQYITRFRPRVSKVPGTALFPKASDGKPRLACNLGDALKQVVYRETGLKVSPHLFRHIAAMLYLRERPGDFETVRRLLKHRTLQTTMDFYADLSNKWAHEQYDKAVLSKWGGSDD